MSQPARVAAVIVNWNSGGALADCVRSLRAAAPATDIVVVDNGSRDGSVEAAEAADPGLHLIRNSANLGLAAGNNQGMAASSAPFMLISNPDIQYSPGSVAALLDVMERRPRAAFVVANPRRPDGAQQTAAGDLPTLRQALLGRQVSRRAGAVDRGFWWDGWSHDEERSIPRGLEACYLVRRAAVDEVGPQDERFRLDWEGIDWSERVRRAGWEIWFCPAAEVVHRGGATIRRAQVRWVLRQHRGMYLYFATRGPRLVRPLLALVFACRAAVKLAGLPLGLTTYERSHREEATSA